MAKKSAVLRDEKRRKMYEKYAKKRKNLIAFFVKFDIIKTYPEQIK